MIQSQLSYSMLDFIFSLCSILVSCVDPFLTNSGTAAYKHGDGRKIEGRRVLVDVERGRTVKGWLPRRLGGGLGDTRTRPLSEERYFVVIFFCLGFILFCLFFQYRGPKHREERRLGERFRDKSRDREKRRRSSSRDRDRYRDRSEKDRYRDRSDRHRDRHESKSGRVGRSRDRSDYDDPKIHKRSRNGADGAEVDDFAAYPSSRKNGKTYHEPAYIPYDN